jgi:hypothetical protein
MHKFASTQKDYIYHVSQKWMKHKHWQYNSSISVTLEAEIIWRLTAQNNDYQFHFTCKCIIYKLSMVLIIACIEGTSLIIL